MINNVLIVGAGRMGQRHIKGAIDCGFNVYVIEKNEVTIKQCINNFNSSKLNIYNNVFELPSNICFSACIIATTALHRLVLFLSIVELNVKNFLLEKPLEQSRFKTREFLRVAKSKNLNVFVNHYRRTLSVYDEIKQSLQPIHISVNSGAMGFSMNGIHWIDFALYLSNQNKGTLKYGKICDKLIDSGRGKQFNDFGGHCFIDFENGSTLAMSSIATSSAPTSFSIITPKSHWFVNQELNKAYIHRYTKEFDLPTYLYGKDYDCVEVRNLEDVDFSSLTAKFLFSITNNLKPLQPTLEEVMPSYDLLFDLLEITNKTEFNFA